MLAVLAEATTEEKFGAKKRDSKVQTRGRGRRDG